MHCHSRIFTSAKNAYYNDILGRLNESQCKQKRGDIFVNIWHVFTSAKCKHKDYLFNVFLQSDTVIQNTVTFIKLTSFTNAAISHS